MATPAWLALLVTAACGPAVSSVPAPQPEPAPAGEPTPASGPILWKVDGQNGPSYLFGTVHLGVGSADVDPVVLQALSACDTFISEADLSDISPTQVLHLGTLPESESLQQMIGDEAFTELRRQLGAPHLDRFRPWFAYVQVIQRLFPGDASLDQQLQETARHDRKTLVFLESVNEQLELISGVIDAADLKQILDPSSSERETLTALIDAYRRGDFEVIEKLIASPEAIAEDPGEFDLMFTARNRAWVPVLAEQLRRGKAFVAVGAGHLAGDTGLLRLLADQGFELQRVPRSN